MAMVEFSLVLVAFLQVATSRSGNLGSSECPCITNSSSMYAVYEALVAGTDGLPASFGLTGCQAYDSNLAKYGCAQNAESYCSNPCCYVDPELCPENKELCEVAGGELGSDVSPHCRTRRTDVSRSLSNVSGQYSYETCGSVNVYDTSELNEPVAARRLRVAATAWAPWIVTKRNLRGEEEWAGPMYDFLEETLDVFDPNPGINIVPGWATAESRAKYPESSYTACVHDVAVGNFDICLADLWITPERNQLVTFLPALRNDRFYLVVPKAQGAQSGVSLWARLERPFLPFTLDAWMAVSGFLCAMSLLLYLRQLCETGCEFDGKNKCTGNIVSFLQSLFYVWHDFLLGQSSMDVDNGPVRKIFSLALAFFILITLASYTASLASLLVVKNQASGGVESIEEAIKSGMTICTGTALLPTVTTVYPRGKFLGVRMSAAPRTLWAGNCSAMVITEDAISSMFSGKFREDDCAAVEAGSLTAAEAQCREPGRDCQLAQVGELLWSVPISFPVNPKMAHSFSWAFTSAITQGKFEDAKRSHVQLFPTSACQVEEPTLRLTSDDLSGTMVISFTLMLIGFVVMGFRQLRRKQTKSGGREETEDPEEPKKTKETKDTI
mmetsp:Transcript_57709/g.135211  ORF Transcript_57709/g.135211 Transcript_57709/m.135211 type:complete len:611 (+) Transcript_57709:37-1869(+)